MVNSLGTGIGGSELGYRVLVGGPHSKDHISLGSILGHPYYGENYHITLR